MTSGVPCTACRVCTPARKKVLDCYITVSCADIASCCSCFPLTNPHCILPNWTSLIFLLTLSSSFSYHCPLTFDIRSSPSLLPLPSPSSQSTNWSRRLLNSTSAQMSISPLLTMRPLHFTACKVGLCSLLTSLSFCFFKQSLFVSS